MLPARNRLSGMIEDDAGVKRDLRYAFCRAAVCIEYSER